MLVLVSALLALIAPPSIQTPTSYDPSSPFSVPIEVTNEGYLPMFSVRADCALSAGGPPSNLKVSDDHVIQTIGSLGGRRKATIRCDLYALHAGFSQAQLLVSISYRPLVWPFRFTASHMFAGIFDEHGRLERWIEQ